MTFDREPDLDNANVGIPEQKGKTESYQIGGFLFIAFIAKNYGTGEESMVKVNGTELNIAGKTVAEYLAGTNYDLKRIAVERNGDIVPKAQYETAVLADGDSVEVVSFVGGG